MENSRRIRLVGDDGDLIQLVTRSWSRQDVEHTIWIRREDGQTGCTCEDASYRRDKRFGNLVPTGKETPCKHQWAVIEGAIPRKARIIGENIERAIAA